MAIALVANRTDWSTNNNGFTGGSIDSTGADLLVVALGEGGSVSNGTISDSKSNTWTKLTQQTINGRALAFFYVKNPTVGTGHTFTVTGTGDFPAICVSAWSGTDLTAPFDVQNGNTNLSGASLQTGSVTPTNTNSLVLASAEHDQNATADTIDSGFTVLDSIVDTTAGHQAVSLSYIIETTIVAKNPTITVANSSQCAVIAVFKAAVAPAALPKSLIGRQGVHRASHY